MIQLRNPVKLLACYKAKPVGEVRWLKNGQDIGKYEFAQANVDGVVTLEIPSVTLDDAGRYTCRVSNALGKAESICEIIIDGKRRKMACKKRQSKSSNSSSLCILSSSS